MNLTVRLDKVTKHFNEVQALRGITTRLKSGDRICLVGHNGAGKSTLLHIMATLTKPKSGTVTFTSDDNPIEDKTRIRRAVVLLAHESMLYDDLTAIENLRFTSGLYRLNLNDEDLDRAIRDVGMSHARDTLVRNCSRGMRQRLSFLRAMLPRPSLMLLDEPFSGLDSKGTAQLRSKLEDTVSTWLMVTHHLRLGFDMANRIWILRHGTIKSDLAKSHLTFEEFEALNRQHTPDEVLR